jgi:TonB-linked SusC/RagA family outer membrane protein
MTKSIYKLHTEIQAKARVVSPRLFLLLLMILGLTEIAQAQDRVVSGKVTSVEDGTSLPGVNVLIKGTSIGTTTDSDGGYSLNVADANAILIFSFIGFATEEVSVGSSSVIDMALSPDITQLSEVVVVGSTIKTSKRELGNSTTSVSSEALGKSGSENLFGALQGKIPGAQITQNSGDPGGGMSIRLRGIKSIVGSSDPLYVIDGIVVNNSTVNVSQTALSNQVGSSTVGSNRMVDINPADIETLNVVTGAAAAAIYGSRAANGVVLITTKKGKAGAPKFTFSTSFSSFELRKKVEISTYGKQFGSTGLRLHPIGALTAAQFASIGSGQPNAYIPQPGETFIPITRDGTVSYLRSNQVDVTRYDYQDEIFQRGIGTDNNFSISGGNDKTQYFTSLSYSKNEGIVKGTDFTRYNFRTRIDTRLTDWAKLSAGLSYANSFANEKANGNVFYSPINSINITNNIYDITVRDAAGKLQAVEPSRVNPLSTIEDMNFTQSVNRTINDLQLNLAPFKGLGIDLVVGVDAFNQVGRGLIKPYPYQATAGLPPERYPNGFASHATNSSVQLNTDLNVSYEYQATEDIKLNAIVGYNYQYQKSDFQRVSGESLAPFIETVSGAASTTVLAGYGLDQFNLIGYFGQLTAGYKNLAFLTASLRTDQSSKFSPSETNQTYPKLGASFIPSDLDVWKNVIGGNFINSIKLRASWGQAGNLTGIGSYDRFWQFNSVPFLGRNTIVPSSQLANSNVKPERMTEIEYGTDISLWNNRIGLSATVYDQQISDLVVARTLAASSGGTSIINNVGTMENKGIEVALNVTPFKTSDLSWDVTFIYNRNRNKVLDLVGSSLLAISTVSGAPSHLVEGEAVGVFYGTTYAKDADGNLVLTQAGPLQQGGLPQTERGTQSSLTPLEYEITRDASTGQPVGSNIRKVIGDPNPDFTGSFASNLTYKNLSFNFLLDAVQGVEVFNADKRTRNNVGIGPNSEKELKGELPRGYTFAVVTIEEWRIDDGSFVKLREVGLSYNFNKPLKGINSVNVGLSGRNLISWDKYNGYDPETNAGGNSDLQRGVDFGNVPIPRSYRVQLTVNF